MKSVSVGLLGLGTIGGGTVNVLARNAEEIIRRVGRGIEVTHAAAKEYDKSLNSLLSQAEITDDAFAVVNDPNVEIIIELIGGYSPARELVLQAIENGKHVVTANKALIALHGEEIFAAAQKRGVVVAFEAAVGGGIPIIKAMREGLAANHIEWVAGIINGTGNFILTDMGNKGSAFDEVLKEAQALGYAEADPTFDVEGIDAAHKLTILGSIAFGIPLQFDRVYTEGISAITQSDISYAEGLGYKIKHLGIARRTEQGVEMRVHPTLIPKSRLLANVDGVMNAVLVKGDAVGPTLYYGAGAGAEPTASAVVGDLIDIVRGLDSTPDSRVPYSGFQPDALVELPILDMEQVESAYYIRMEAEDRPGVTADVSGILGSAGISIEAIHQEEPAPGESRVPLVMLTHTVEEGKMNRAIEKIEALDGIAGRVTRIRMEHLEG